MLKLATTVCATIIGTFGMAASAAPDKPLNAATTDKGTFCVVRAAETDPYVADAECQWHTVTKRDQDGNLVSWRYQDKGTLQPGQTAPSKAVRIPLTQFVSPSFPPCTGTETISPSGSYSSNLTCTN